MAPNEQEIIDAQVAHLLTTDGKKPSGYRVDDDKNVEEKDLKKSFLFGTNKEKPGTEGKAMGGGNFGKNNLTPSGDDKNNPSRNAGYTNEYFRRTEPSDEHPEDTNFKSANQDGQPEYDKAHPASTIYSEIPKPEHPEERGDGENDRPHEETPYQEGTDDNDGSGVVNIPGPNELPDQQKVGEPDAGNSDVDEHIES